MIVWSIPALYRTFGDPSVFAVSDRIAGMATEPCDGCGSSVSIGGGIAGIWSSDPQGTGGMTLEFEDGSEYFLCFACIEALPEEPTEGDFAALDEN